MAPARSPTAKAMGRIQRSAPMGILRVRTEVRAAAPIVLGLAVVEVAAGVELVPLPELWGNDPPDGNVVMPRSGDVDPAVVAGVDAAVVDVD